MIHTDWTIRYCYLITNAGSILSINIHKLLTLIKLSANCNSQWINLSTNFIKSLLYLPTWWKIYTLPTDHVFKHDFKSITNSFILHLIAQNISLLNHYGNQAIFKSRTFCDLQNVAYINSLIVICGIPIMLYATYSSKKQHKLSI